MHESVTRAQGCAMLVIAISMLAIAVAVPFATLGASATWRARLLAGLGMLEALSAMVRRVLGG